MPLQGQVRTVEDGVLTDSSAIILRSTCRMFERRSKCTSNQKQIGFRLFRVRIDAGGEMSCYLGLVGSSGVFWWKSVREKSQMT